MPPSGLPCMYLQLKAAISTWPAGMCALLAASTIPAFSVAAMHGQDLLWAEAFGKVNLELCRRITGTSSPTWQHFEGYYRHAHGHALPRTTTSISLSKFSRADDTRVWLRAVSPTAVRTSQGVATFRQSARIALDLENCAPT